uniref:Uncharacterized protein n=1 Tax=Arundo donax TaxID=35708 RepID=A0A0A9G7H1_ARUDO
MTLFLALSIQTE